MLYRQKTKLDRGVLRQAIADQIGASVVDVEVVFEDTGYSGRVFHLTAHGPDQDYDLSLKGVSDELLFRFYQDVLAPFELNSPRMLELLGREDQLYVLMEYIPHESPDWGDATRYRRAIDWLARKDRIAGEHLEYLRSLEYVQPFDVGQPEHRLAEILRACDEQLDPLLTSQLGQKLRRSEKPFARLRRLLVEEPLTVTHNDFQMLNILFGIGSHQGELYVVDWTGPAIGTVGIDLATLVHVAPPELRTELIERYQDARPVSRFEEIFQAAQTHVHLSILTWMIDAMRSGQQHAVYRPRFIEIVEQLEEFFT